MTRLAIFHPTHLVATELREALEDRPDLWQSLVLLATRDDEVGTLTEVRGSAAVVTSADEDSFDNVDVAFFFGSPSGYESLLSSLPPAVTPVVFAESAAEQPGNPVVAGLNLETVRRGEILLSPHPGAVALALLLHPLLELELAEATATILQPVSMYGKAGLDEMFDQTRDILAFRARKEGVLPAQLAFNVLHPEGGGQALEQQTRRVLDRPELVLRAHLLQSGVFHGFGISLTVGFAEDPGHDALLDRLEQSPRLEFAADPHLLGPVDAAARQEILLGSVERHSGTDDGAAYSLWAVLDNLTVGGATNALALLEALADPVYH
ncbi:MAG: hypothetical protein MI919_16700 [Holophagales bacterium]|nr:hypothetical protein [Holophagales bacterium]